MTTPATLNSADLEDLNRLGGPWRRLEMSDRVALWDANIGSNAGLAAATAGANPFDAIIYSGQPTTTNTFTVAVTGGNTDVYEFVTAAGTVSDDTNIGVAIAGSADLSYANLVAAINRTATANGILTSGAAQAPYLGTCPLYAVLDSANNTLYMFEADTAGGTPIQGAGSNIAFSETLDNAGLLRTNMNLSPAAARNTSRAATVHTVTTADLALTQPMQIAVPFLPTGALIQVVDSTGVPKNAPDVRWVAGTAVSGQNYLNVYLNAAVAGDGGVATGTNTVTTVASQTHGSYFSAGSRSVKVLQVEITAALAPAGGTLVYNGIKTTAAGAETTLASAVNVAGIGAHDPTNITYDDAALPQTIAATEKLQHQLVGGAGLSAPLEATFTTYYTTLVANGDLLLIDIWGA